MVLNCHYSLFVEWFDENSKKKKKKKCVFFYFFFRETPTSPWAEFRAKFRPLGRLFCPIRPLAWPLLFTRAHSQHFRREIQKLKNWIWVDEMKKIFFRKTNKKFWVGAIFLGWSGDSKQNLFYSRPGRLCDKYHNLMSWLIYVNDNLTEILIWLFSDYLEITTAVIVPCGSSKKSPYTLIYI